MMDADGIVLGSPNYINQVTAQLKTVLDRMADSIHCQSFAGKYGCGVCTAGGSMADEVADYMNATLQNLGATTVGRVGVLVGADPNAITGGEHQAKELGRRLAEAVRTKWKDPAQEKYHHERKEYFKRLVSFNRELWKHEVRLLEGPRGTVSPFSLFGSVEILIETSSRSWGCRHDEVMEAREERVSVLRIACPCLGQRQISPKIAIVPQKVYEKSRKRGRRFLLCKSSPLRGSRGYQIPRRRREAKADLRHSEDLSEIQGDAPLRCLPPST